MPGMQYVDAPRSQTDSGDSQKRRDVQDTGVLAAHEKKCNQTDTVDFRTTPHQVIQSKAPILPFSEDLAEGMPPANNVHGPSYFESTEVSLSPGEHVHQES